MPEDSDDIDIDYLLWRDAKVQKILDEKKAGNVTYIDLDQVIEKYS